MSALSVGNNDLYLHNNDNDVVEHTKVQSYTPDSVVRYWVVRY